MKVPHIVSVCAIAAFLVMASCGGPKGASGYDSIAEISDPAPWDLIEDSDYLKGDPLAALEEPEEEKFEDTTGAENPEDGTLTEQEPEVDKSDIEVPTEGMPPTRLSRYKRIGNLREAFNDSNKYHYAVAEKIGIRPIESLTDAYYINRPMVEITGCRWYDVDTLKHSMPYLVPEAARLLETIGRNFMDSLDKRNAPGHKFRVTSLLRTSHTVKRLRRVNRNATDSSTHKFGTTFDISYARFNYEGKDRRLSDEELKYILAEVLRDLRLQNKCMIKFERHTPCFHITATGR